MKVEGVESFKMTTFSNDKDFDPANSTSIVFSDWSSDNCLFRKPSENKAAASPPSCKKIFPAL